MFSIITHPNTQPNVDSHSHNSHIHTLHTASNMPLLTCRHTHLHTTHTLKHTHTHTHIPAHTFTRPSVADLHSPGKLNLCPNVTSYHKQLVALVWRPCQGVPHMGGPKGPATAVQESEGKEVLLCASSKPYPPPTTTNISFCTVASGWWLN